MIIETILTVVPLLGIAAIAYDVRSGHKAQGAFGEPQLIEAPKPPLSDAIKLVCALLDEDDSWKLEGRSSYNGESTQFVHEKTGVYIHYIPDNGMFVRVQSDNSPILGEQISITPTERVELVKKCKAYLARAKRLEQDKLAALIANRLLGHTAAPTILGRSRSIRQRSEDVLAISDGTQRPSFEYLETRRKEYLTSKGYC